MYGVGPQTPDYRRGCLGKALLRSLVEANHSNSELLDNRFPAGRAVIVACQIAMFAGFQVLIQMLAEWWGRQPLPLFL